MIPNLGSLEETVLLIVLVMDEEAYGFTVSEAYREEIGKTISIPAVHTVLKRLEKKGFVKSSMRGATQERGGRKKRIYEVTDFGYRALAELRETREKLWSNAPKWSFN